MAGTKARRLSVLVFVRRPHLDGIDCFSAWAREDEPTARFAMKQVVFPVKAVHAILRAQNCLSTRETSKRRLRPRCQKCLSVRRHSTARGFLFPECAPEIDNDDNHCRIHARDLVAHACDYFVDIIPGRSSGKVDVLNDLAELKCTKINDQRRFFCVAYAHTHNKL